MQILTLYLTTAFVFLVLDAIMLTNVIRPVFERHVADLLADSLNLPAAIVFYLFYIGGVIWFASLPALRDGAAVNALISGALIGAMAYGTYDIAESLLYNTSTVVIPRRHQRGPQ